MYKQSTNTDPYKAIYGTKGSDVLGLQQQLNKLGAGLKEDALYGPLTAAAFAKYNTPSTTDTSKPIGASFAMPSLASEPTYTGQFDTTTGGYKDTVDESAIRSKTLADFQDRINAINQVYANKLAEAKQQGIGRVGQTTSILANRGLAGSARGGAIAEGTLAQNRQIEGAIDAEKAAALSAIYADVNSTAQQEAERRRQAIEGGAKSYIDFIKGQETTKQTNIGNVAGAFIAQGIDPNTMTQEELKGIADKLKVSTTDIISAYKQKAYEKQQADIKANPNKELSQGEALYVFNPATGKYEQQGYNPKTSVAGGGNISGEEYNLTPKQATLFNTLINQQNKSPLIAAADRTPVLENSIKLVRANPSDAAQQLNLSYAYIQALDTYQSAVREGELTNLNSIDSKIGALSNSIQKIQNGQIVRPDVAKQIADAAETIVSTIKSSAKAKAKGFESQANVLGIGDAYRAYIGGYTPSYNTSSGNIVTAPDGQQIEITD